ncbi:MAG: hypothetical protein GY856_17360 [bacterium]|nr:hypothetical protein [bacterium]
MLIPAIVFSLGFLTCFVAGVRLERRFADGWILHRIAAALIPLALFLVLLVYLAKIGRMPYQDWNAARVAPSVALASGYDLYYGPESGPVMSTLYGPVKALLYLPAAFASTPTTAIAIAGILNVVIILLPLLLVNLHGLWTEPRQRILALAGFVFSASVLLVNEATHYMATMIHVDAPAVGLGLLSCFVLMAGGRKPGNHHLASAATLAVLAAWTKQVEVPLLAAQVLYLSLTCGRSATLRFIGWAFSAGILAGLALVALFGFEEMVFSIVTLPARHPWLGGGGWFVLTVLDIFVNSSFFLLLILVALRVTMKPSRSAGRGRFEWLREQPWTLLLLAAVFLVPTSALGRMIAGGRENSYHTIYYLIAAAAWILTHFGALATTEKQRRIGVGVVYALAAGTLFLATDSGLLRQLSDWRNNPQEEAFECARARPGEVYFPWNPLSSLMAEGKVYHFDYSVFDRDISGFRPGPAHFREHLPAQMRYVAVQAQGYSYVLAEFLPEFSERVELEELPGWTVYGRGSMR